MTHSLTHCAIQHVKSIFSPLKNTKLLLPGLIIIVHHHHHHQWPLPQATQAHAGLVRFVRRVPLSSLPPLRHTVLCHTIPCHTMCVVHCIFTNQLKIKLNVFLCVWGVGGGSRASRRRRRRWHPVVSDHMNDLSTGAQSWSMVNNR